MRQAGFTLTELLIVIIVMGVLTALGLPRIRAALEKTNVRSARVAVGTLAAKARAAAVQRGCPATLHLRADGRVWVEACRLAGAGRDTLGVVEDIAARFGVTLTPTRDSVRYDPRGLNADYLTTVVRVAGSGVTDSVVINQLGKVIR